MTRRPYEASAESRFAALGRNGDDIVVVLGPDGCHRYVSPSVERILGYAPDALIGRPSIELYHPADAQRWGPSIRDGTEHPVVVRARHRDGRDVWLEVSSTPIRDEATGDVIEVVGIHRDVSKQERFGVAPNLDGVNRLDAAVTHDYNNVLSALVAVAERLRAALDDDDLDADLADILLATEDSSQLLRRVLGAAGRSERPGRAVAPGDVVASMALRLRSALRADIQLEVKAVKHASEVPLTAVELEQIVLNLAMNAQEAMPNGGRLAISVDQARDRVTIEVEDDGRGMAERALTSARRPFFGSKPSGSGLGLWVVQTIARRAKGTLEIASTVGEGTKVTLSLPAVEPKKRTAVARAPTLGRVLVVDDDEHVRLLVTQALTKMGYGVLQAADGAEALEIIERDERFDLLITDVVMPSMGGLELVRRVRGRHPVPAVYMTGYVDLVLDESPALRPLVLTKPFTLVELADTVKTAIKSPAALT